MSKRAMDAIEEDEATVKKRIDSLIAEHDVVIFSKSYCPFCRRTKALFTKLGVAFKAIEMDISHDGELMQLALKERTGQRTVPNIFVKGSHIGGNDDAHAKAESGELQKLLGLGESVPPPPVRSKSGRDITEGLSDGDAVKERVKTLVQGCPVVVFSKSYCPFCMRVKALFESYGETVCAMELDHSADGPAIQSVLLEVTGQRTVPSVFVGGTHVGGNDDTQAKAASGELQKMIEAAKAKAAA